MLPDKLIYDGYDAVEIPLASEGRIVRATALTFGQVTRVFRLMEYVARGDGNATSELVGIIRSHIPKPLLKRPDEDLINLFTEYFLMPDAQGEAVTNHADLDDNKEKQGRMAELERHGMRLRLFVREYAVAYHGPPPHDQPWPLTLFLLQCAPNIEDRRANAVSTGAAAALSAAFGGSDNGADRPFKVLQKSRQVDHD